MHPVQSSGSLCISSGTSSSLTISAMTARPPFLRTRKISSKSCRFDFGSTKFKTQLETTTSMESLATSGCLTRNSSASASAATNDVAFVIGLLFNRSEEHTSELQSLRHLVCRLLLEKKKKTKLS